MQVAERGRGFLRTILMLYRQEGFGRFYRGALPILFGCLPAHAAFFTTYEFTKSMLHVNDEVRAEEGDKANRSSTSSETSSRAP